MSFTIGSLFDGSGGFPRAASLCGGTPLWASEVEPYPIAVTRSRFPRMKHLGSVTDIKGGEVEPVDVLTFGSPCQDLSVAGKRAGLKHEANGDEETTRSGLFMEAVRIIREMREATHGVYPRFAVWENVPGAFSSNKGEDFRIVLEELIKIVEAEAEMPPVPEGGWPYADCYLGDGWSLAYRVFDAQYWGVPQRRRRIYLVLDLGGQCAGKVSFERDGLRGYFAESRTAWQTATGDAESGTGADDREGEGNRVIAVATQQGGAEISENGVCPTITAAAGMSGNNQPWICYSAGFCPEQSAKTRGIGYGEEEAPTLRAGVTPAVVCVLASSAVNAEITDGEISPCLMARAGTCGNQLPLVAIKEEAIPIHDQATRFSGKHGEKFDGKGNGLGVGNPGDPMNTLTSGDRHAVCFAMQAFGKYTESDTGSAMKARDYKDATDLVVECAGVDCRNLTETPELYQTLQAKPNGGQSLNYSGAVRIRYIVRRLTPTECTRLQGFADRWGHPDTKTEFTDEEYHFWLEVRNTHAEINGKPTKSYTKDQMLKWYNKLHTDSSEYKMWGNGIALPCALYVMQGIADVLN